MRICKLESWNSKAESESWSRNVFLKICIEKLALKKETVEIVFVEIGKEN